MRFAFWLGGLVLLSLVALVMAVFLTLRAEGAGGPCMPLPVALDSLMQRFSEHVIFKAEGLVLTRAHDGSFTLIEVHKEIGCFTYSGKASEVSKGI